MSDLDELLKQIRGDLADLKLRDERGEKVPEAEREAIVAAAKNTRGETKFAPPGASPEHQAAVAARAPDLGGARPVAKVDGFALADKAGGGLAPAMKALAEGTGSAGGFLVPAETSAAPATRSSPTKSSSWLGPARRPRYGGRPGGPSRPPGQLHRWEHTFP